MSGADDARPDAPDGARTGDARAAAAVAGGSSVVLLGGFADKGLRFLNTWFLTWALGGEGYGLFVAVFTALNVLAILAGLGLNNGMVYFGARYLRSGERARLKGTLLAAVGVATLSGLAASIGAWVAAGRGWAWADTPEVASAMQLAIPALALTTLLNLVAASVRAAKDMTGNALAFQLGLSAAMLAGSVSAAGLGWLGDGPSARAVLVAYCGAVAVSLVLTLLRARRHYGALLMDRALRPELELGALMRFSLPQSLAGIVHQLNRRMDVLMLTSLAALTDAGFYQVAAALAVFGNVPINAAQTMFRPVIAELVYAGETDRLRPLVQAITRWLLILAAPIYLIVFLVPDLILALFKPEFIASSAPLLVLMGGQAIYLISAASIPLIPMSGRSSLSLLNSALALGVNVGLNLWLIPEQGAMGAAIATSVALATLSLLHVVQARWLLGTTPLSARAGALLAVAAGGGIAVRALAEGAPARLVGVIGVLLVFAAVIRLGGATPEDEVLLGRLRKRLGGLARRFRR